MLRYRQSQILRFLALWLCITIQSNEALRILGIFPFQMRSQFVMGEELFKALAVKGYQVDVYSHFPLKKPVPNYNDFSLQGTLPALTNNVTYEDVVIPDAMQIMSEWLKMLTGPLCDLLGHSHFQKLIKDPPKDPPYDLAIIEFSIINCFIPFGRHLNIPVIGLQAVPFFPWQYDSFGNPVNLAAEPNIVTPYMTPMPFSERLGNFITHNRIIRIFNTNAKVQDEKIEKYFGSGYPSAIELQKDVALIFINDDASLYGAKPYVPKVIPAAGLHVVDHNETLTKDVKKWLDESKDGCILFTFGSMIRIETFPRKVIDALYKSFRNIAPVRVLLKVAKPEELPPGLPSNVLTQPWFQQGAVLKHKNTKAFVTHGGLMGTQESIYYEVPMIGIPLYFDEEYTISAYSKKKIAIKLKLTELVEVTFTHALKEILENPAYRIHMKKVSRQFRDRPVSIMDSAIFWVEYIHRHGKDALKSAAEDVPWWQASLLDVYAFLITVVLVVLFVCGKLIKVAITVFHPTSKVKTNKLKRH